VAVGGSEVAGGSAPPRRRAQSLLFAVALLGLVAATVVGFLLARVDADDVVDDRADRAALQAAASVEASLATAMTSIAGAGVALDADGELDPATFQAFADDVLAGGEVRSLALVGEVPERSRADVEAQLGVPISVLGPDGALVPAPAAAVHHVVIAFAAVEPGRSPLGLDYAGDPVRRGAIEAATATGEAAITGLVRATASGDPALAIVRPLLDPDDGVVRGFAVTGLAVDRLEASVAAALGEGQPVTLLDGDEVLFGPAPDDEIRVRSAAVEVPGREWRVLARVGAADLEAAWVLVGAGAVAVIGMLGLVVVTERHQRRLARANSMLALGSARSHAVQELAGRLARALSGEDVATAVLTHLPAAVGAASAAIATTTAAGPLELLGQGDPDAPEERPLLLPDAGSKVEEALASGEPAWLSSPLAWRDDTATATLAADGWALALLPLSGEDVEGVLAVSYPSVHTFAEEEKALLETVGVLAARALGRARRYDTEHSTAVAFQRSALPTALPEVPGLSIAARYRPGTEWASVGGDWYDVVVVDERRVVLVVGDVVGHGMAAAASMGRLRTAFQTIAPLEGDPGKMVEAISAQVSLIPDAFCTTAVCVVVDLEARTLTWCRAGHPPPLLLGGAGPRLLDEVGLPPLGVLPGEPAPVHTLALDGGESLIIYTDGVVERRGESLDEGFGRLEVVGADLADLEPEELIDALLLALVPADEQTDDVVVLVVPCSTRSPRRCPTAPSSPTST
jgi:CHASE1-domain containing sensor protein